LADGKIEFRLPEGCKMGVIGNRFYIIGEVHSDIEEGVIGEEDNPLSRHLNGLKSMNQTVKDNLIGIIQYTASLNINYISILFDANGAKDIFKHEGKKAVARLRRELDAVWVEKAEKQKLFTDLSDALSELGAIDQSAKLVQVEGSEFFRFENADYEENWTDFQKSLFRRNQKFPGFIDFLTDELDQYLVNMEAQIESM